MGSFGERMQREREMRGITLEEIAESTKISVRCLRAVEQEEFHKLPGGIFNKGFVRAYARYLGIDEEQAVVDFMVAAVQPDLPLPTADEIRPGATDYSRNRKGVAVAALLLGAGFALWHFYPAIRQGAGAFWKRTQTQAAAAAAVRPETTRQSPSGRPSSPEAGQPAPAAATEPPQEAPAATSTEQPGPSPATPQTESPPATDPAASPPAPAAPARREFVVEIRARKDCWLSITADGKVESEGMLSAPAERLVRARNRVVLTMGNAAGLEVLHNGRALPPLGGDNQVTTVVLTPEGVQR